MSFLKSLFGKGKQRPTQTHTISESKQGKSDADVQVVAVALVSDMFMMFDSDDTLNKWVANILHLKWPGLKLPPKTHIEAAMGFKGGDDQVRVKLTQMLQQVIARTNLDEHKYVQESFSAHSELPPTRIWGVALVNPSQFEMTDDAVHFIQTFNNHLQRLRTASPQLRAFLDQYFGEAGITEIASAAADKMRLTNADGKQHSTVLSRGIAVYHITTLPVDMSQAKDWFIRASGGYTKLLENAWNSLLPQVTDCSVWCHIIYGSSKRGTWVHMAICPVRQPAPINATIMPIEFLTSEERQRLGL